VVGNWKRLNDYALSAQRALDERRRLDIPDDKLIITYIAWLSQERRLGALLDAVEKDQGIFLLIGGDGPLREDVERRSRDRQNIRYLGYVDPSQVPLYTAVADVIYYGFDPANPNAQYSAPNKLFEALAAGKAVITGRFGEIADIVQRERCGLCLPSLTAENLAGAFQALRQREILKLYQQNAGRAGRERYNWPRAAQELLRAYERLGIGRDGRGGE
jgi:glycosyltransferase involved in cell wall biosynthesis